MAKKQSKQPARLQEALVLHKYKRTEGLSPCVTEEELDFIIRSALPLAPSKNYDIKYRMGDELNENE